MNKVNNINRVKSIAIANDFKLFLNLYFNVLSAVSPTPLNSIVVKKKTSCLPGDPSRPGTFGPADPLWLNREFISNFSERGWALQSQIKILHRTWNDYKGYAGDFRTLSPLSSMINAGRVKSRLGACRIANPYDKVEAASSRLNKRQDGASTIFSDRLLEERRASQMAAQKIAPKQITPKSMRLSVHPIAISETSSLFLLRRPEIGLIDSKLARQSLVSGHIGPGRAWQSLVNAHVGSKQSSPSGQRKITLREPALQKGKMLKTREINNSALKMDTNLLPETGYPVLLSHSRQKAWPDLAYSMDNVAPNYIARKPLNLVFKRPMSQDADTASVNKENLQTEKKISMGEKISTKTIDTLSDIQVGNFKERSTHKINIIADKVYKIIEKRITIERDRRGLR